jgi:hypothetical protein
MIVTREVRNDLGHAPNQVRQLRALPFLSVNRERDSLLADRTKIVSAPYPSNNRRLLKSLSEVPRTRFFPQSDLLISTRHIHPSAA